MLQNPDILWIESYVLRIAARTAEDPTCKNRKSRETFATAATHTTTQPRSETGNTKQLEQECRPESMRYGFWRYATAIESRKPCKQQSEKLFLWLLFNRDLLDRFTHKLSTDKSVVVATYVGVSGDQLCLGYGV